MFEMNLLQLWCNLINKQKLSLPSSTLLATNWLRVTLDHRINDRWTQGISPIHWQTYLTWTVLPGGHLPLIIIINANDRSTPPIFHYTVHYCSCSQVNVGEKNRKIVNLFLLTGLIDHMLLIHVCGDGISFISSASTREPSLLSTGKRWAKHYRRDWWLYESENGRNYRAGIGFL